MRNIVKIVFLTITFSLSAACSHTHGGHGHHDEEYKAEKLTVDNVYASKKKIKHTFRWYGKFIKKYAHEMEDKKSELESLKEEMKKAKGADLQKLKLKVNRKESEIKEHKKHYNADMKKFVSLYNQLDKLREELSSHEGHEH